MRMDALEPVGKGQEQGKAAEPAPRSLSGKIGRGMQPEGGCSRHYTTQTLLAFMLLAR